MIEELLQADLEFREGSSDKVYRAAMEKAEGGFVVNFAYGRRGSTLNTGSKTTVPVAYAEAVSIYERLVKSKTAKGYKPVGGDARVGTGLGISVTDRDRCDTGLRAQLLTPITEEEAEFYLGSDHWGAQEKFNGRRMLLRRSGDETTAANRDGLCVGFPDAVADQVSALNGILTKGFVIDGESIGDVLYAFDLLQLGSMDYRQSAYRLRLETLLTHFGKPGGNIIVVKTAYGSAAKRSLMKALKAADKEGIVFKDLRASWSAGRPASGGSAVKCKFWATCSCLVVKVNARRSVELALSGKPIGNVTIPPNHDLPAVGQVVEIRYLYVAGVGGSLYQPVYLGVRVDVAASDCTFERQQLKYKAPEE